MSTPDTDPALDAGSPAAPKRQLGPSYYKLFSASTISNLGDGVGLIAYPWLASAVTRNPILIALVAVAQRLPWLVFTLPVGVITDRHDRRTLMIWSNVARTVLTLAVAFAVLNRQGTLPGPDVVADETIVIPTNMILYGVIILATLLMGIAEVLVRQLGADVHALDRPHRTAGEGERADVERRARRQHVHRATARSPPDRGVVQPAVLRRRRHVRRVGRAHRAHPPRSSPPPSADAPERRPWRAEVGGGVPVALAPRTAPTDGDHPRVPQRARHGHGFRADPLRPGGARHGPDRVRRADHGRSDRRCHRRLDRGLRVQAARRRAIALAGADHAAASRHSWSA